ncbi:MAG: hypothetical protein HY731_14950 [Candidatus Tectomicrobia bacterium]|nr:hypothetical protein [Candidatus Tectomicrobia bacterium]
MSRASRLQLFEEVAAGLLSSYDQVRAVRLDAGLSGTSAENVLVEWIRGWLPTRVSVRNGAVLSVSHDPTTQRDCILFDQVDSPVFHRLGNSDILPIEGVLGAIELNYGKNTTYAKLAKDAAKLSEIAEMAHERLHRVAVPLSHLSLGSDASTVSREELIAGLALHRAHDGKPLLLIYAEQVKEQLIECARRVMEHNKSVGVRRSVDGLFILRKGFALHLDPQRPGWMTHRQAGAHFACLAASPGNVLLKMQSVILKHLFLAGKVHPEGFDPYIAETGQGQREAESSTSASDDTYISQADAETVHVRI